MSAPRHLDPEALTLTRHLAEAVHVRTGHGRTSLRAVSAASGAHYGAVDRLVHGNGQRPSLGTFVVLARWAGLRVALVPVDLPSGRLAETVRRLTVENDNLRHRLAAYERAATERAAR